MGLNKYNNTIRVSRNPKITEHDAYLEEVKADFKTNTPKEKLKILDKLIVLQKAGRIS